MLEELAADPSHGLLHSEQFRRGRTVLLVQVLAPGQHESIYYNVPSMLLGAAVGTEVVGRGSDRADDRIGRRAVA